MTAFAPRLQRRLGDGAANRILVDNPARLYAIAGAAGAAGADLVDGVDV
jgi:hypothetical protein